MADIRLQIINMALTNAGETNIASLSGNDATVVTAISNYEMIVGKELEEGDWSFATKIFTPSLLTDLAAKPLQYQWQVSADCTKIRSVLHCGYELEGYEYLVEGKIVRVCKNTDITVRGIYRAIEDNWSGAFRMVVAKRLEAVYLRAREDRTNAFNQDQVTDGESMKARYADSSQRASRQLGGGDIVKARQGRRHYER